MSVSPLFGQGQVRTVSVPGRADLRRARPSDRLAVEAMVSRCTRRSLRQRFHAVVSGFPEPYLTDSLSGRSGHFGLVAEVSGTAAGFASCVVLPGGVAELSILVEDIRQGRGLGARLLSQLVIHARRSGSQRLTASFLAEQTWLVQMLRPYGIERAEFSAGVIEVALARDSDVVVPPNDTNGLR